jgi:hypothetical protein
MPTRTLALVTMTAIAAGCAAEPSEPPVGRARSAFVCTHSVDPCLMSPGAPPRVCVEANTCAGESPGGIQTGNEGEIASNGPTTMVVYQGEPHSSIYWASSTNPRLEGSWAFQAVTGTWDLDTIQSDGSLTWLASAAASPECSATPACKVASDPIVAAIPRVLDANGVAVETPDWFAITAMLKRDNEPSHVILGITTNGGASFDTLVIVNDEAHSGVDRPLLAVDPETGFIYVEWKSNGNWFRWIKPHADNPSVVDFGPVKQIDWQHAKQKVTGFGQARMVVAEGVTPNKNVATYRYIAFSGGGVGNSTDCADPTDATAPATDNVNFYLASKRTAGSWKFHSITSASAYPLCVGPDYGGSGTASGAFGNMSTPALAVDALSRRIYVATVNDVGGYGPGSRVEVRMSRDRKNWTVVGDTLPLDVDFIGQPAGGGWQYAPNLAIQPGVLFAAASEIALTWRSTDDNTGLVVVRATVGEIEIDGTVTWRPPVSLSSTSVGCSPECAEMPFTGESGWGDYNGCTALAADDGFACLFADERLYDNDVPSPACGAKMSPAVPWVGVFKGAP